MRRKLQNILKCALFIIIFTAIPVSESYSFSRNESSVEKMYSEEDLNACPLFVGDYINWGCYDQINVKKRITKPERLKASERLYEVCAEFLNLQPEDILLEVGCGMGEGLSFLTRRFKIKNVTGVDQSQHNLKKAITKNPNAFFLHQKAELMSFDHCFDKILCLEAAQHFPDISLFLEKAYNNLDDGGVLVLSTYFGLKLDAKRYIKHKIQTVEDGIDNLHYIDEVINKLEELGFSIEVHTMGEEVFPGFDKWTSQTTMYDSWTRNWLKAYQAGIIDYFIIKASKPDK